VSGEVARAEEEGLFGEVLGPHRHRLLISLFFC
jgi:hypothetical protein